MIQMIYLQLVLKQQEQQVLLRMKNRYIATMLLAAVGDAIGYRQGAWQFNRNGVQIHEDMMNLTKKKGIKGLIVNRQEFPYSDDTVMHIATAQGLLQSQTHYPLDQICSNIAKHYKKCMRDMKGRAPGVTCIRSARILDEDGSNWKDIQFQKNGGGCGAAMRAACIGLYYYDDIQKLTQISIESGRTTHHNPLGYLGSYVSALFTSFAIKNIEPNKWLYLLLQDYLPKAKLYVANNRQGQQNIGADWKQFQRCWEKYAQKRKMRIDGPSNPVFPQPFGVRQRQDDYHYFAINGWPGALGVDSVIIAYDALLSSLSYCQKMQKQGLQVNRWDQICLRGMLHGGDSDSTGTIAGAWYGALYGFDGVHKQNYQHSQRKQYIEDLGQKIYTKVYNKKEELNAK